MSERPPLLFCVHTEFICENRKKCKDHRLKPEYDEDGNCIYARINGGLIFNNQGDD